ncbi:hypothetical protein Tco_0516225 [Tanacetum coccineum]
MVRLWWCVATADSGAADTARWLCGGGVKRMSTAGTPRGGSVVAVGDGLVAWRGCRRLCRGGGGGTRLVEMEVMVASNEDDSEGSGGGVVMMGVCRLPWKRMKIFVSSGSMQGGKLMEEAKAYFDKIWLVIDESWFKLLIVLLGRYLWQYNVEYSEEEEAEAMAETMEQYMSKTQTNYGSGVVRPKIEEKDSADAKKAIQEMAEYSQKWHNGTPRGRSTETSDGLAAIQA